uniref:Uncharacterized protein n=1 Tax=Acrobeloides nanus TaxID=290746 RepID=A0A914CGJ5_9BILA
MPLLDQNAILTRQLSNVSQRSIVRDPQLNPALEFWSFLFNEINILARSGLISLVNIYTRFHRYCFNLNFTLWNLCRRTITYGGRQVTDYLNLHLWPKKKFQKIWLKNAFNHTKELNYDEVRWFIWDDTQKRWALLKGHDSIRLEIAFYERNNIFISKEELASYHRVSKTYFDFDRCAILNGFYCPNETFTYLMPIYWDDIADWKPIRRGTWFDYKGQPLEPEISDVIEKRHLTASNWRKILPFGLMYESFSRYGALNRAQDNVKLAKIDGIRQQVVWTSMVDVYLENDIIAKQQNSFFNALFSKNFLVDPIQDLASNPFSAIFDLILSAAQVYAYAIIERFWNRAPAAS